MEDKLFLHHKWAELGLIPPYNFHFIAENWSSCNVCGTGIRYEYHCSDKVGKKFVVGSDCISRLDDTHLTTQAALARKKLEDEKKEAKRLKRLAKRNAMKAEKERLEKIEQQKQWQDNLLKFKEDYPEYLDCILWAETDNASHFAKSVLESIIKRKVPTINQILSLNDAHKSYLRSLKPKTDCPLGKMEIYGEVVSVKTQRFGYTSTLKMLIHDDRGFKVFGTVPSNLTLPVTGKRVKLTATIKPSDNDTNFGYYSRPSNACLME